MPRPPPLFSLLLTTRGRGLMMENRVFTFYPVKIADFVNVGPGCIVEAAQIGHGVDIGKGSIIVCSSIHRFRTD